MNKTSSLEDILENSAGKPIKEIEFKTNITGLYGSTLDSHILHCQWKGKVLLLTTVPSQNFDQKHIRKDGLSAQLSRDERFDRFQINILFELNCQFKLQHGQSNWLEIDGSFLHRLT